MKVYVFESFETGVVEVYDSLEKAKNRSDEFIKKYEKKDPDVIIDDWTKEERKKVSKSIVSSIVTEGDDVDDHLEIREVEVK